MGPICAESVPRSGHVTRVALGMTLGLAVAAVFASPPHRESRSPANPAMSAVTPAALTSRSHRCGVRKQARASVQRQIDALLVRDAAQLQSCWNRWMVLDDVRSSTAVIAIESDGKTKTAAYQWSLPEGTPVEACLDRVIEAWQFAPSAAGTYVFDIAPKY